MLENLDTSTVRGWLAYNQLGHWRGNILQFFREMSGNIYWNCCKLWLYSISIYHSFIILLIYSFNLHYFPDLRIVVSFFQPA